jgi:Holliday junction resolvase RusA-like endonuclease
MTPQGYTFRVIGTPAPKGSTKSFRSASTGRVVTLADSANLEQWEADVLRAALMVRGRRLMLGPVSISVTFYLRRPQKVSVTSRPEPIVKPDLSKLLRGVEDPLSGVLYHDDAQIVSRLQSTRSIARATNGPAHSSRSNRSEEGGSSMDITISCARLAPELALARRVTERKTTIPVYAFARLDALDGEIRIVCHGRRVGLRHAGAATVRHRARCWCPCARSPTSCAPPRRRISRSRS